MSADNLPKIPRGIWALGFVSMFMDTSSELIHSLLPVFMVGTLGASMTSVGVVEGIAEAAAMITRIFSGTLSDYLGKRKFLTLVGYGLAAVTKPLFPLANSIGMVMAARFLDRIGKGIRGAPRDALIGDLAPPAIRGACFGLRQSLDTIGAVTGPLLAIIFMLLFSGNIHAVLWVAVLPATLSVAILAFGTKEPKKQLPPGTKHLPVNWSDIRHLGAPYWHLVSMGALFSLARFSEAFLILKAEASGLPVEFVPAVMIVMNIAYALSAYPAGMLSDTRDRKSVFLAGVGFLVVADILLALGSSLWLLGAGVALWGVHMGFTQGLLAAMVTDTAPERLRGTAYGVFNLASGLALLAGSVLAGFLWDAFGPGATFFAEAAIAAIVLAGVFAVVHNGKKHRPAPAERDER